MPAIWYKFNYGTPHASDGPGGYPVEVFNKDGTFTRVHMGGFICTHGATKSEGKLVKVRATITSNRAWTSGDRRYLKPDECVIGLYTEYQGFGTSKSLHSAVLVVVDDDGWPIVVPIDKTGKLKAWGELKLINERGPGKTA